MYEAMLRISKMVDMMYEAYEIWEKVKEESNASSTYSSPSSHHSYEKINHSLQVDNVELKFLLREEKEDKKRVQLYLQATEETLEELKRNDQSLQAKDVELRRLLQE